MTFTISLPTKQFFPDPTPATAVPATAQRDLPRMPWMARVACAGIATLISATLMASVAWGISTPDGDATAATVTVAAVQPAGSR